MKRFEITDLGLGVKRVGLTIVGDTRGSLTRLFCAEELVSAGWNRPVAQVNWVENSNSGTARGLHYQRQPYTEAKLLFCMTGEIKDVVVDIRRGSSTFLKHVSVSLSASLGHGILIPAGFAHGYQCLSETVSLIYFHDTAYEPTAERGLNLRDPRLAIEWPLPLENLSERDIRHAMIDENFEGEVV